MIVPIDEHEAAKDQQEQLRTERVEGPREPREEQDGGEQDRRQDEIVPHLVRLVALLEQRRGLGLEALGLLLRREAVLGQLERRAVGDRARGRRSRAMR